jgi:hypothetical protein
MKHLVVIAGAFALAGCTFGDVDTGGAAVTLEAPAQAGVADGATPIVVTVTGEPGRKVDLAVAGGRFAGADADLATSVFLIDGMAEVDVVADQAGTATVYVAAAEISTAVDLTFELLRFAAGPAEPVAVEPGIVVHELCVAANTARGAVVVAADGTDEVLPIEGATLRSAAPSGLGCPDADGPWRGYARLTWRSATGDARAELVYEGAVDAGAQLVLAGAAFAGYAVTGTVTDHDGWVEVALELELAATGGLPATPAAGVSIALDSGLHLLPSDNPPVFFGSSSGGGAQDPRTDSAGRVTLYFDVQTADPGTYTLFVTPEHGATHRIVEPIEVF